MESTKENTKQIILKTLSSLPDDTSIEDAMYRLYILDCIQKGQDAIQSGQFVSADELLKGSLKW